MNFAVMIVGAVGGASSGAFAQSLVTTATVIGQALPLVFVFYLASSFALVYDLDRSMLPVYVLFAVLYLSFTNSEYTPMSLGGCLVVVTAVTVAVGFLESRLFKQSSTKLSRQVVQLFTGALAAVVAVYLLVLPLFDVGVFLLGRLLEGIGSVSASGDEIAVDGAYFAAVVLRSILSFMGFHGHNVMFEVFEGLYTTMPALRAVDVAFTGSGGTGSTMCFLLAYVIWARGKQNLDSNVIKSIPFGIFNINEILVYGYPLVWNPFFLVPFIVGPCLLAFFGLLGAYNGLMDQSDQIRHWMTPAPIQAWVVSPSPFMTLSLWFVGIGAGTGVYWWFLSMHQHVVANDTGGSTDNVLERIDLKGSDGGHLVSRRVEVQQAQLYVAKWFRPENLILHYQPIIGVNGKLLSVEALLRVVKGGQASSPCELLNAVEVLGLEIELDKQVLNIYQRALAPYLDRCEGLHINVNITPEFAAMPEFSEYVTQCVQSKPLPTILELTESSPVDDLERLCTDLSGLREKGLVKIAIDDFGSGYSSMRYLQSIQADKLKIDGGLMPDLDNPRATQVVESLVVLGHKLGFEVVFEGVETLEQLAALVEIGIDGFQGYYLARPMPAEHLVQFIDELESKSWQSVLNREK